MFHAPMGRFQLELIYYFTYSFTVVPPNSYVFLSCRPFDVNTKFSTGLVGIASLLGQERTAGKKHTTIGWDDGGKIGKIINEF